MNIEKKWIMKNIIPLNGTTPLQTVPILALSPTLKWKYLSFKRLHTKMQAHTHKMCVYTYT